MISEYTEQVLISWLSEYRYCPRRFYLKVIERQDNINDYMAEGTAAHTAVHQLKTEKRKALVKAFGFSVFSKQYGLYGVCDAIEFMKSDDGTYIPSLDEYYNIVPIEYKHGKMRNEIEYNIQLCAQAICLEEMFGCTIPSGDIYYTNSHQRFSVDFDESLRKETLNVIEQIHKALSMCEYERPDYMKRCPKCSVYDICNPKQRMTDRYMKKLWNIAGGII